ncbi:MAG TPA: RIP metalloprotease RseP [Alphaproteobacteria bacterium]|nr:RIP metalloprotease RseP [Alphaproteobacteria bacterium]
MDVLLTYALPFLVVLTVLVFVHELGHYLVARRNGVRVEVFSVGFGPELFGVTDRAGTRWKFSAIPFGGYVKMFGDAGAASQPSEAVKTMTAQERAVAFQHKRLGQRAAIVVAGPLANFLFAVVMLLALFTTAGEPFTPPIVGGVEPDTAAAQAGLQEGDRIVEVDGSRIERFEDITRIVQLRPDQTMVIRVEREGEQLELTATPRLSVQTDNFGNEHRVGLLGIKSGPREHRKLDPASATWRAVVETVRLTGSMLEAIGQMIVGVRDAEEIGGPIAIAKMSGDVAQLGIDQLLWFMAVLSINLGMINLFPVPMLDGGHLLFYGIEALRGRPLGERAQEWGFRIGLALVLTLMLFATWNDLTKIIFKDIAS